MRCLIKFSYDGTKFHGFQRQNEVKNVQGTLERVLSDVLESTIVIKGCGRTDAGVHATRQCAHFDTDKKITREDINIINKMLNDEIVIKKWKIVKDDFHARHDVKWKKKLIQVCYMMYIPICLVIDKGNILRSIIIMTILYQR